MLGLGLGLGLRLGLGLGLELGLELGLILRVRILYLIRSGASLSYVSTRNKLGTGPLSPVEFSEVTKVLLLGAICKSVQFINRAAHFVNS